MYPSLFKHRCTVYVKNTLLTIIIIFNVHYVYGQSDIIGKYYSNEIHITVDGDTISFMPPGEKHSIELKKDSSYIALSPSCTDKDIATGTWQFENDTLTLHPKKEKSQKGVRKTEEKHIMKHGKFYSINGKPKIEKLGDYNIEKSIYYFEKVN